VKGDSPFPLGSKSLLISSFIFSEFFIFDFGHKKLRIDAIIHFLGFLFSFFFFFGRDNLKLK
jgi:hypothetical protein